ncbi:hypothetical protein GLW08_12310 [Pontibacillus yanchengensis]|uniref:Uncharacterized protein n=2 Tax=Pontibacillus yanchengensis TaxID=462910 RepID=A0ACC7VIW7_9BACI|nr:hypothetical protein [Pontibacillus yanchengensis]MYL33607.1 hypothetical protein [Pontibacillus yanchengensis]MYL54121.1 hypothetical protein [Pontibacillus yanchengensis]
MVKKITIGIFILIVISIILEVIGVNISVLLPIMIQWATKFVLPWIFLYWFVRFVRAKEVDSKR